MSYKRFYFKVVYTNITKVLEINTEITIDYLISSINGIYRQDFNIHPNYYIHIVPTGNLTHGDAELGPEIVRSRDRVCEKFDPSNTSFYIRPVHPGTQEFIRRDDYSTNPFRCPIDESDDCSTDPLDYPIDEINTTIDEIITIDYPRMPEIYCTAAVITPFH